MMHTKLNRRYQKNLGHYLAEGVLSAILISCVIALIMIVIITMVILPGLEDLTPLVVSALALLVCCMTICLTGGILYFRTKKITAPITRVNNAMIKIASGDFSVRVQNDKKSDDKYQYENELDELTHNLNKMVKELEGMDYMRKDFMSNVSHEVKTPVAAITGFSEILLDDHLSKDDQKEYLTLVHQESIRLSNLCESMLQVSRLDHLEIISVKDSVRIDEQLRKCMIILSEKWQDKHIEFVPRLEEITFITDKNLMMQVWINLIDNAMKYSEPNTKIHISLTQSDNRISIVIIDEGPGIPTDKMNKIYNRFYQCEESHKKQGSGLGLAIVKRILDLLHGTIQYESDQGKGTKVTVVLGYYK